MLQNSASWLTSQRTSPWRSV